MSAQTIAPSHRVFADLAEDLTWFIKCPEIRLLHVSTTGTERPIVVHQMALTEGHGHNKSPFFVLEDAHTKDDEGWMARAERITVIHEARRAAMASEGYVLPPITAVDHGGSPLVATASQLEKGLHAQQGIADLDGLVVVLAPTVLALPETFADSVLSLVQAPSLSRVRFIVVELGELLAQRFVDALGPRAMSTTCTVDPLIYRREQSEALAASAAAPVGASPEVSAGGAGPKDVIAPPRFGKPARDAEFTPEQKALLEKELGPAVALLGPSGALLHKRITGAALAVQEQRFGAAITLQTEAWQQCLAAGLVHLACILELTLAAYLLHSGDPTRSRVSFESAAAASERAGLLDVAAQARLGLGAALVVQKDFEGSIHQYDRAGELATKGNSPLLAIEAWRTAGQIALRARAESAAVVAWKRALSAADAAPPEVLAQSSAPTVARALAKVMVDNGSFAAANSLIAQAEEYERSRGTEQAGDVAALPVAGE